MLIALFDLFDLLRLLHALNIVISTSRATKFKVYNYPISKNNNTKKLDN